MIGKLRRDEQGIALITVLILTMVALALVSALTAYALGSTPISRHDQDWNAALGAAQAGLPEDLPEAFLKESTWPRLRDWQVWYQARRATQASVCGKADHQTARAERVVG